MKISIGTWNIGECVPKKWDLNNTVERDALPNHEVIQKEIVNTLNKEDLDIVCFQEFPVEIDGKKSLINAICSKTQLKYCVYVDTCPSFLFQGGKIGVAIFSKTPIENYKISYFNNPNLTKISKQGQVYRTFDKAIISADLFENLTVITCHAISFVAFDNDPKKFPDSYQPLHKAICDVLDSHKELVLAGDINVDDLLEMFPDLQGELEDKLLGTTTVPGFHEGEIYANGLKQDCIYVTKQTKVTNVKKHESFSDHYFCTCVCATGK